MITKPEIKKICEETLGKKEDELPGMTKLIDRIDRELHAVFSEGMVHTLEQRNPLSGLVPRKM